MKASNAYHTPRRLSLSICIHKCISVIRNHDAYDMIYKSTK
jgi:hypothetical protein